MKRGGRLPARSAKTAATLDAREECRRVVVDRDRRCQLGPMFATAAHKADTADAAAFVDAARACRDWAAGDVHELVTRGRGGDETDPANCVLACRPCHDWAHHREPRLAGIAGALRRGPAGRDDS